jgi:hypothetical protein
VSASPPSYVRGRAKLAAAVEVLATGGGDVRWRLHGAYLHLVGAVGSNLPTDIRTRLESILKKLTARKHRKSPELVGRLSATLNGMRIKTGAAIAKEIVSLEADLRLRR